MKIGPEEGRLYSQKRCDILNIDQLMNCEGKLSHSWELFCSKDQMSLRCEEAVQLAPDMWTRHDTFILNLGVRCGRPGQSGQKVWDISLTPWVISEGNGFTQFKPVKNTELIGKEVPSPLSSIWAQIHSFVYTWVKLCESYTNVLGSCLLRQ